MRADSDTIAHVRTGYALLRVVLDTLADRGCSIARRWVLDGNEQAIQFYLRQGFRLDGRVQEDESLTPGHPLRELGMTNELRTAAD
ncbi:GNAT family N-acetyltransferase [Serinibacter salmoneus]|uniref:GNAT family N-acetyltransferase n=1 Tax=Serinibacter salmoneus TaxID=556530 RepID=UPI00117AD632|nr:GNAT family N-acetyltransferase [Serinibacter salmoneus]